MPPCGIFGWSFLCPFKCGFFKRLFRIGSCTNDNITTQSLLTSFINNITMSNHTIAKNGPTPEDRALNYLILNDTTFNFSQLLGLNSMMTNMVQFRIRQRYALLTLWFQQAFTNTTWNSENGWLVNGNECDNWRGISCAPVDLRCDVGVQNVVTGLNLFSNNIQGTIPADLGLLTALTNFNVGDNALTGTLPVSIGQWTSLKIFSVSINALTGTLPASIGRWPALTSFGVFNNEMTGTIPASISNWSQIQIAYFDGNQFTGTMPVGICPYIVEANGDRLEADCLTEINCTCCTVCL
jgi:Leucine-rich repeat (LRR) protein